MACAGTMVLHAEEAMFKEAPRSMANRITILSTMTALLIGAMPATSVAASLDKNFLDQAIQGSRVQSTEMRKAADALDDLRTLTELVRKNYASGTSYGSLSGAWREIRDKKINGWHENAFGGETNVNPQGHKSEMFSVQYTNVPRDACIKFATTDLGAGNPYVFINSFKGPFTVERARELCGDATAFTWIFF